MKLLLQRWAWALTILAAVHSHAAFDAFLKIEGIDGEVVSPGHSNWLQVLTLTNRFLPGSGAAGSPSSTLWMTRRVDKASPKLFERCADGSVLADARLELMENTPSYVRFFDIRMSNIVVTAFSNAGAAASGEDRPQETLSLNFEKITWTYTTRRAGSRLPEELRSAVANLATGAASGTTNAASFTMTGIRKSSGLAELQWQGVAGRTYDVYAVSSLTGAFSLRGKTTATADGPMTHLAAILPGAMFFVVEERP